MPLSGLSGHQGECLFRFGRAGVAGFSAFIILGALTPGSVSAQPEVGTDVVGQWTQPFEENGSATPRCERAGDGSGVWVCKPTAVHTAVLPDGRVLYFNALESQENAPEPSALSLAPSSRDSQARVLDVRSGTPRWLVPTPPRGAHDGDMFCADLTAQPDGRILIAGGTDWSNEPSVLDRNQGAPAHAGLLEIDGLRSASLFDPATNTFAPAAPMKHGRWCPMLVVGPDGDATVFGGVTRLVRNGQLGNVRRTETYRPGTNTWAENYAGPASETELPLVPRMVLAPNGQFFYPAAGQMWGPFGQSANEAMMALFQFFNPKTKEWSVSGVAPLGARSGAFVVPLTMTPPFDQMTLVTGGGTLGPPPGSWLPANPFTTLTTVDANGNVTNRSAGDLNHPRWFSSGVLLPDGKVLAVGGGDKDDVIDPGTTIAVKTPELFDPATDKWTDVAPHARDRVYHNSAVLLPDMRVLLGGNSPLGAHYAGPNRDQGGPFANNDKDPSFEIWSPPYLFRGPRPTVTKVQKGVSYGETFAITTPDAGLVESVVLLRTPSPEHAADSDQRALRLEFTRSGATTLTATAPPSGPWRPRAATTWWSTSGACRARSPQWPAWSTSAAPTCPTL